MRTERGWFDVDFAAVGNKGALKIGDEIPCEGFTHASLQLVVTEGAIDTGVLSVQGGIGAPAALQTPVNLSAAGMSRDIDVSNEARLSLEVTTLDAGLKARVHYLLRDETPPA